jgi:hypothetical protein
MTTKRKSPPRKPPPMQVSKLEALTGVVLGLDQALRAALERKPNQALQELVLQCKQLVYKLGLTRQELADMQDQLRANTAAVERLLKVPTIKVGASEQVITDADIDRRIQEGVEAFHKARLRPPVSVVCLATGVGGLCSLPRGHAGAHYFD